MGRAVDRFQRQVDYLRLSITDRCNERCLYCLPQGLPALRPRREMLSFEEILRVVEIAAGLGFSVFRVTGGEPLVRRGAAGFLERLASVRGARSVGLSTNGTLLPPVASRLRAAGVHSVNISLDTLDPVTYHSLTGGDLRDCLAGIEAARAQGFASVKLNTVLLRGINEDQILALARFAADRGLPIRFIELMPLSGNQMPGGFLSAETARGRLARELGLDPAQERLGHGPARYYRSPQGGWIGFISAMTDPAFCESCNKLRLTSDGKIRPCLGDLAEIDLRELLRSGGGDEEIAGKILHVLQTKPQCHGLSGISAAGRPMCAIGG